MRPPKQGARGPAPAELTDNMADAVIYLSRVAHDAGLETISTDLLSISSRLRDPGGELMACRDHTGPNPARRFATEHPEPGLEKKR